MDSASTSQNPPSSAPSAHPADRFLARWLDRQAADLGLSDVLSRGEAPTLREAYQRLPLARQNALENSLGKTFVNELISIGGEHDKTLFGEALLNLAGRQERAGREDLAASLYTSLPELRNGRPPSAQLLSVLGRSEERLKALQGGGTFGSRAERFVRSITLDSTAERLNHGGALLGLATIGCSYIRPLRPLAAAGLHFLSKPAVSATLLASGAYILTRQAPEAWAATGRLWNGGDANHSAFADFLTVSGFGLGVLGTGVGIASFGLGGRAFRLARQTALAEGHSSAAATRIAWYQGDAVRRAVNDPEIWVQFARGNPGLRFWQRTWLARAGLFTDRSLLYGSAAVGLGRFAHGLHQYANAGPLAEQAPISVSSLLLGLAMDVSPAVTVHLYRAGRGNRSYGLGPAMSQELTERHYDDPTLRDTVLRRLDAGVPTLSPAVERAFIRQANTDLAWVETALRRAEALTPLKTGAQPELIDTLGVAHPEIPRSPEPVTFGPDAHWVPHDRREVIAGYDMSAIRQAYASGEVSPMGVLQILLEHPAARDGSIFPRPLDHGHYRRKLLGMAEESERRYREGRARPLEGVLIAVKDIFPGADGRMHVGSKTARVAGHASSPVVQALTDLGAIPITVGMVAAASGGTGKQGGFGYIPHPTRPGFDPAGSSSATAHVVGHPELPISAGIGTDTGGSVSAPAGAVGLFGFVPPAGLISTKNMVPFATFLDRVGVLARESRDAMEIARYLSKVEGGDPHQRLQNPGAQFQPAHQRPTIAYLESLVSAASPQAQMSFLQRIDEYRAQGYEVQALGPEWDFIGEAPMRLYPFDAYVAGAFTHTNPLQNHRFDPPRRVLDDNLMVRLPKGALSLRLGFYDQARELSRRYESLIHRKIGSDVILASPSTEAISTADIFANRAGARLDGHDRITMAKNRIPGWGQLTLPSQDRPEVGVALTGTLPQLMHFSGEFHSLFRARTTPPPEKWTFPQSWRPRVIQGEGGQHDLPSIPYAARVSSPDETL